MVPAYKVKNLSFTKKIKNTPLLRSSGSMEGGGEMFHNCHLYVGEWWIKWCVYRKLLVLSSYAGGRNRPERVERGLRMKMINETTFGKPREQTFSPGEYHTCFSQAYLSLLRIVVPLPRHLSGFVQKMSLRFSRVTASFRENLDTCQQNEVSRRQIATYKLYRWFQSQRTSLMRTPFQVLGTVTLPLTSL